MDKFSAYNLMNAKGRNFPLALDGNSAQRCARVFVEDISATGGFFRMRRRDYSLINLLNLRRRFFPRQPQK